MYPAIDCVLNQVQVLIDVALQVLTRFADALVKCLGGEFGQWLNNFCVYLFVGLNVGAHAVTCPASYCLSSHASTSDSLYITFRGPSLNDRGPMPWCRHHRRVAMGTRVSWETSVVLRM